jgi:hypothetical protein
VFLGQSKSAEQKEFAVKKITNWDPSESRQFSEVIIQKSLCSHPSIGMTIHYLIMRYLSGGFFSFVAAVVPSLTPSAYL